MLLQVKLAILAGVIVAFFAWGKYQNYEGAQTQKQTDDLAILKSNEAAQLKTKSLQNELDTKDVAIQLAQQSADQMREIALKKQKVIYVKQIENPDTVKCINDSGLLKLINDSTATTSSATAK